MEGTPKLPGRLEQQLPSAGSAAQGPRPTTQSHQVGCEVLAQQVQRLLPCQPLIHHLQ